MKSIAAAALIAAALSATLGCATVQAQQPEYPTKTVRMVVPAGPGTSLDLLARSMSEVFTKRFGQTVYVESKPGAGGVLGANEAKNGLPDGYTLLLSYDAMENYPIFIKDNTFVLSRDLAPVSLMAGYPMVFVTTQTMEAKNLKDILAYGKANPGKINFGVVPNTISQLYGAPITMAVTAALGIASGLALMAWFRRQSNNPTATLETKGRTVQAEAIRGAATGPSPFGQAIDQ